MGNMVNKTVKMVDGISGVIGPTLTANGTTQIKSDSMELAFLKASPESLKEPVKLDQGSIEGPDFGEMGDEDSNGTNGTAKSMVQQVLFK